MRYHIVGCCIAAMLIGCGGSGFTPGDNVPVEPDANGIDADAAVGVDAAIDSPQSEVEVDSQVELDAQVESSDSQVEVDSQIEPEADVPDADADAATPIDVKVCQTVCENGKVRFCDENGILGDPINCATGCMTGANPVGCWNFWKCDSHNDECKCTLVKDYPGPGVDTCANTDYTCCVTGYDSSNNNEYVCTCKTISSPDSGNVCGDWAWDLNLSTIKLVGYCPKA